MNAHVDASVLYEVTLDVDAAIGAEYRAWLHEHVAAMLEIDGFRSARVFEVLDPAPAHGRIGLCVAYDVRDGAALQRYFDVDAARMRADGLARFGTKAIATRRVLRSG